MSILSINPTDNTTLRQLPHLTQQALHGKVETAQSALKRYQDAPPEYRVLWMKKLAALLEHEMEELATLLSREFGSTITSARHEILNCADCCRISADNASRYLSEETVNFELSSYAVRWEPIGVLLGVMPWNSPFWQAFRFLVPALLAGNTALIVHAASVPQCGMEIELLVHRAGFPRGTVQVLLLEPGQRPILLNDRRVKAVTVRKPAGSGALVVMPSADLMAAIRAGVAARCANNGQSPLAVTRFVVHTDVYEDFEMLFSAAMEDVAVGNPLKDETELGPLASAKAVKAVEAQVAAAVASGGRIIAGGMRMVGAGNFFEPTTIADVPREAAVRLAPIHGPVALLIRVASLDEAIAVANDAPQGFAVSVWTKVKEEQRALFTGLRCDDIFVNRVVTHEVLVRADSSLQEFSETRFAAALREFALPKTLLVSEDLELPEMALNLELAPECPERAGATRRVAAIPVERIEAQAVTPPAERVEETSAVGLNFQSMFERALQTRSAAQ